MKALIPLFPYRLILLTALFTVLAAPSAWAPHCNQEGLPPAPPPGPGPGMTPDPGPGTTSDPGGGTTAGEHIDLTHTPGQGLDIDHDPPPVGGGTGGLDDAAQILFGIGWKYGDSGPSLPPPPGGDDPGLPFDPNFPGDDVPTATGGSTGTPGDTGTGAGAGTSGDTGTGAGAGTSGGAEPLPFKPNFAGDRTIMATGGSTGTTGGAAAPGNTGTGAGAGTSGETISSDEPDTTYGHPDVESVVPELAPYGGGF